MTTTSTTATGFCFGGFFSQRFRKAYLALHLLLPRVHRAAAHHHLDVLRPAHGGCCNRATRTASLPSKGQPPCQISTKKKKNEKKQLSENENGILQSRAAANWFEKRNARRPSEEIRPETGDLHLVRQAGSSKGKYSGVAQSGGKGGLGRVGSTC